MLCLWWTLTLCFSFWGKMWWICHLVVLFVPLLHRILFCSAPQSWIRPVHWRRHILHLSFPLCFSYGPRGLRGARLQLINTWSIVELKLMWSFDFPWLPPHQSVSVSSQLVACRHGFFFFSERCLFDSLRGWFSKRPSINSAVGYIYIQLIVIRHGCA